MSATSLSGLVRINHRFHRSVSLARDWNAKDVARSYLLTPTAADLAARIAAALPEPVGVRAWSITGPFGSGKSAFGVFLLDVLCQRQPRHPRVREIRKSARLRGVLAPVIVTGRRARLAEALLEALVEAVPVLRERAEALRPALETAAIIGLFEEALTNEQAAGDAGLVVVIDEFGKLLEHAALHPGEDDLFVLQGLAELAAREPGRLVVVTIQHAAFADYLELADPVRGNDWRKVQGRFTDETFFLPTEQFLSLIDAAIETSWPKAVADRYHAAVARTLASPALAEARKRAQLADAVQGCAPIDPLAALLLWPLFRSKLAQNERSLFAFLGSAEPSGFRDFLGHAAVSDTETPFYRIADLYDYVMQSIGRTALTGDRSRYWAEAEGALNRLPADAADSERAAVKTVTLLSLFGAQVGLRPNRETIQLAMGSPDAAAAVDRLEQRSILIYRRHSDEFGVWQGSDFDVGQALAAHRRIIDHGTPAERVTAVVQPQPRLALRHYATEGTPRFFSVDLIDHTDCHTWLDRSDGARADGRIAFVLTERATAYRAALDRIMALPGVDAQGRPVIFALPEQVVGLSELATDLAAWNSLMEDPALRHDAVARSEVAAGRAAARERLERVAGSVLGLPGFRFDPAACRWIRAGADLGIATPRAFAEQLSGVLAATYAGAPRIFNELINRESLTSAAAKARRNLIEAMLTAGDKQRLGLKGFPPEASMYDSLLKDRFHVHDGRGRFAFAAPRDEGWADLWAAINGFFEESASAPRPVTELYETLQAPPFGLRMGPLPVLLAAAVLQRGGDIAMYEEGVYLPRPGIEVWERLLRRPEDVSIRLVSAESGSSDTLRAIARPLEARALGREAAPLLMTVVMPVLSSVAQLNPFARRTRTVSEAALAVRLAATRAKDPHEFLLSELPQALDVDLTRPGSGEELGARIQAALDELEAAYPRLLDKVEKAVFEELAPDGAAASLPDIRQRADRLIGVAGDVTLRGLLAALASLRPGDWRFEVGRVVNNGKPPDHWADADIAVFHTRFRQLAREIIRLEEMVLERGEETGAAVLRVGLLDGSSRELRRLVKLGAERRREAAELADRILAVVGSGAAAADQELAMSALADAMTRLVSDGRRTEEES